MSMITYLELYKKAINICNERKKYINLKNMKIRQEVSCIWRLALAFNMVDVTDIPSWQVSHLFLCIVILTLYMYTVHIPGTCYFFLVLFLFSCWQQSYAGLVQSRKLIELLKDTSFLFGVMTNIHRCIKNTCLIMVCECMGLLSCCG